MKHPTLHQLLQDLHQEIGQLKGLDAASQTKIETLFQQVEAQLQEPETPSALGEQLQEAIMHFEVTHPTLTRVLNQISSMLSSMGI